MFNFVEFFELFSLIYIKTRVSYYEIADILRENLLLCNLVFYVVFHFMAWIQEWQTVTYLYYIINVRS